MYTETLSKPVTIGAESAPEICRPLTVRARRAEIDEYDI
jgi:hypothetical protein